MKSVDAYWCKNRKEQEMWRLKAILFVVFGVLFFGGLAEVYAVGEGDQARTRRVSGEIEWIDVKLGLLSIKSDAGQDTKGIREYSINQNDTRVTDPTDQKFLVIKDLQAGQHVTLELVDSPGETLVRKIIADPLVEPVLQEATGELETIDADAGTLVIIEEEAARGEGEEGNVYYFVFDPEHVVLMQDPVMQPVQLELKPGDLVKVAFEVKDGNRYAHSITLLKSPSETTSTTTTTTTSTTVTR